MAKRQAKINKSLLTLTIALSLGTLALSACSQEEQPPADTAAQEASADNTEQAAADSTAESATENDTAANAENPDANNPDTATDTATTKAGAEDSNAATAATPTVGSAALVGNGQSSVVTNPTEPGTPEDTVKKALDTLYFGQAQNATQYYDVDMANFAEELKKTQYAFQQTVESVTFTNTRLNDDNTEATIEGELKLKDQSEPAPLAYQLKKVDGEWKILG